MNRHQRYGLIHKGMKAKLTVELGEFTDEAYRACLLRLTGKASCKEMTDWQLIHVIRCLQDSDYLTSIQRPVVTTNPLQPTDAQWRKLAALSYAKGWNGLKDAALTTFVKRTAHVSNINFLTRQSMSEVITGLEKWSDDDDGS